MFDKAAYTQYEWLKLEIELKNKVNALLAEKDVLQRNVKMYNRASIVSLLGLTGAATVIVLLGPAIWLSVVMILLTTVGTVGNAFLAGEQGAALGTRKYRDSVQERLDNAQSNLEMFYIANDWPIPFKGSPEAVDAAKVAGLRAEVAELKRANNNQQRMIADLKGPKQIDIVAASNSATQKDMEMVFAERIDRTRSRYPGGIIDG